jgi:hypothetical protein
VCREVVYLSASRSQTRPIKKNSHLLSTGNDISASKLDK